MGFIEEKSLNLSNRLGDRLNKSDEEKAVLNYGLFIIMHTFICIITTFLLGLFTGMVLEMIVISVTTAWLKRYSGGAHASTPEKCMIIGLLLSFVLSLIGTRLENNLNIKILIILITVVFMFTYYILYKKCPVGSKNKPLKKESTRIKLRKKAFKLVNMFLVVVLILLCCIYKGIEVDILNKIVNSVLLGVSLQIFVLTNIGSKFIEILDKMLNVKKLN